MLYGSRGTHPGLLTELLVKDVAPSAEDWGEKTPLGRGVGGRGGLSIT